MSTSPAINLALGSCDDLIGGSSLMWRYHHQVTEGWGEKQGKAAGGEGAYIKQHN
jgi:hypothetical protein